jgi:hypothetical protein
MGHIVVTLACNCGVMLHAKGAAPSAVGVTTSRLLTLARERGWTRLHGRGWRCPACSGNAPEATP